MSSGRVTIKDIAAEAGVSVSLVSFVMNNNVGANGRVYRVNEETARKIREVAARLDYHPNSAARSLRSGKTRMIGVILSDISNNFFAEMARCIEDAASQYGYVVFFGSSDEDPAKFDSIVRTIMLRGVDGLIVVPCEKSVRTIKMIAESGVPFVLLDRDVDGVEANTVLLNNRKAGHMATSRLLAEGCRKVMMVSYAMRLSNIIDREAGYRDAMAEYGYADNAIVHNIRFRNIPAQMEKVMADALERGVDGIVFATNTLTIQGVKCMREKMPGMFRKIKIVAFDESEAFSLSDCKISYIRQPVELFGSESVRILIDNITNGTKQIVNTTLSPQFVEIN